MWKTDVWDCPVLPGNVGPGLYGFTGVRLVPSTIFHECYHVPPVIPGGVCGLCIILLRGGSLHWEWCQRADAVEYWGATHAFNTHMRARKHDKNPSVLLCHCIQRLIETKLIRHINRRHKSDVLAFFIASSCHPSFRTFHGQQVSLQNIGIHLICLWL